VHILELYTTTLQSNINIVINNFPKHIFGQTDRVIPILFAAGCGRGVYRNEYYIINHNVDERVTPDSNSTHAQRT